MPLDPDVISYKTHKTHTNTPPHPPPPPPAWKPLRRPNNITDSYSAPSGKAMMRWWMRGDEITGMRNRMGAGRSGRAHTLTSKSPPCVAMGTGPSLTQGESKKVSETRGREAGIACWSAAGSLSGYITNPHIHATLLYSMFLSWKKKSQHPFSGNAAS